MCAKGLQPFSDKYLAIMAERLVQVVESNDNVATMLRDVEQGESLEIRVDEATDEIVEVTVTEDVEFGHKIALRDIREGSEVVKYGKQIGNATRDISAGDWVHVQNVESNYGRGDLDATDGADSAGGGRR